MDLLTDQAFFRSFHILFGIAWIGLLYYFNFVQTEYVKVADPDAKADVMKKLAPNALWWFRWAAFFTFLTGLILIHQITARIGTEIILGNTYHLFLRPGLEILQKFNGLHKYMNWHKPILTDSGGYQIMSLSKFNKIDYKIGAIFKSHLDGKKIILSTI